MYVTRQFIKRRTRQVASRPLDNKEMYSTSKIRMKNIQVNKVMMMLLIHSQYCDYKRNEKEMSSNMT